MSPHKSHNQRPCNIWISQQWEDESLTRTHGVLRISNYFWWYEISPFIISKIRISSKSSTEDISGGQLIDGLKPSLEHWNLSHIFVHGFRFKMPYFSKISHTRQHMRFLCPPSYAFIESMTCIFLKIFKISLHVPIMNARKTTTRGKCKLVLDETL